MEVKILRKWGALNEGDPFTSDDPAVLLKGHDLRVWTLSTEQFEKLGVAEFEPGIGLIPSAEVPADATAEEIENDALAKEAAKDFEETPAAETPAAETPAAETPAAETPAAETPAAETPAADDKKVKK